MLVGGKLKSLLFGRKPTLAGGTLGLAGLVAAISIAGALRAQDVAKPPETTPIAAPTQFVWLDQNWTADQRTRYHHESQGTLTLPFPSSWILALEQPDGTGGMFIDPAYLATFGFIPSPHHPTWNRDRLPVGFARTTGRDPRNNEPFDRIGFTCAACHTARLDFNGTSILVDGGPALIDVNQFGTSLAVALLTTLKADRFRRFADRVLGPQSNPLRRLRLRGQVVGALLEEGIDQARAKVALSLSAGPHDVAEGFGRLDALNRIGNTVFGEGIDSRNLVPRTAPVAYPHIWDTHWFTWVQYNSSIEQPMVRNAGEAMGVGAIINFNRSATPQFTSTLPVGSLYSAIEQPLRGARQPQENREFTGLTSPPWPEQILGPIDRTLAAQGGQLYAARCQVCHLPAPNTAAFWTDSHWQQPNGAGERYLDLELRDVERIGTDPAQARDMDSRIVRVPLSFGLERPVRTSGSWGFYGYGDALGQLVEKTVTRWYDSHNVPQPMREIMNGHRPNGIRHPLKYKARPLNGIWATPPFLHNGSIRTIWDLLSPYRERPDSFMLGSHQYDPVRLGFVDAGGFELVSVEHPKTGPPGRGNPVPGNMNTGHLFDTPDDRNGGRGIIGPPLSEQERRALIEYLKTL